jgi:hypothetical protein
MLQFVHLVLFRQLVLDKLVSSQTQKYELVQLSL